MAELLRQIETVADMAGFDRGTALVGGRNDWFCPSTPPVELEVLIDAVSDVATTNKTR